jgi:ribosomal protein L16/L10AE
MLSPKKVKWRKQQKGRMKGAASSVEILLLLVNMQLQATDMWVYNESSN